ncbi:Telomere length regulation protein elg1 [Colletotrichum sidae]|uniref:Telomere length regulation protein elg1 n=1 Tax=Colletotrichum sidae TaxID=1347389 RepID=A0A4R8TC11_9PEZI|nr:Telomere length regulation protein elg1 [Colletotrichum sidae]
MAPEGLDSSHKKLHPFFAPGKAADATPKSNAEQANASESKTDNSASKRKAGRPRKQAQTSQQTSSDVEAQTSDVGDDGGDNKRQKTTSVAKNGSGKKRGRPRKSNGLPPNGVAHSPISPATNASIVNEAIPITPVLAIVANSVGPLPRDGTPLCKPKEEPKPTKVLKFNPKTGTIGSPPKPKPTPAEASKGAQSSTTLAESSRVVTIRYGQDAELCARIGSKIQEILASTSPKRNSTPTQTTPRKSRAKAPKKEDEKAKPKFKDTHPLFMGKPKGTPKQADAPKPKNTIFSSTPCSPKKQRQAPATGKIPQFGVRSMGLKIPGASHPAWPAQGMAHIRGLETEQTPFTPAEHPLEVSSRKSKGQVTKVVEGESVVDGLAKSMDTLSISRSIQETTDDYEPPPTELRLPQKHFESGRRLRSRIRPELRTCLPIVANPNDDSDDDVLTATLRKSHPAVARLYNLLETNLSAYDRSQCEELSWAHKYAPERAAELLQSGNEGNLLKEWLQTLQVQAVAGTSNVEQKGVSKTSAPRKKRKRNKLDGFVVSSGDEAEFFPPVSDDDEDDWLPTHSQGGPKKTVVRRGLGKDLSRLTNAVVLSGPHGSGKTAAVYAVAKELEFEVFEINASSRRSGKDVMEKVGDMTQNHLVRQNGQGKEDADDETSRDIKSGKQGTVMSFFKPKPASKPEPKPQPKVEEAAETTKAKPQNQKQSLILLEEVDVLYEEDKQFWATIVNLIVQSKRPFVMTCNDENLVPLHNFVLYGIFRFAPPPTDLAVDVLLLIAANEGHALQRQAISALYESKSHDLRASLMELNFWCQLGVGDRRGGFDWFYPRWPKGCDKDENGDVVRVISEGTYLEGMGWGWQGLGVDLGNWHESLDMASWANSLKTSSAGDRAMALDAFSDFADAMSAADLCASGDFGLKFQEPLDPKQPVLPNKARDDFVVGRRLLEAPPMTTYSRTATAIATSLKSAARRALQAAPVTLDSAVDLESIHEGKAIQQLRRLFVEPARYAVISRYDLSLAFDPIAVSEKAAATASNTLEPSIFDRTMRMITLEVAPYVRSIVEHDHRMMHERMQRSTLLSEGGRPGKRMRSTRSAISAQEGVARSSTRTESYFHAELSASLVMGTGGEGWQAAVDEEMSLRPRAPSPPGSTDDDDLAVAPAMSAEAPVLATEVPNAE